MEHASTALMIVGGGLVMLGALVSAFAPAATMPLIYAGIAVIALSCVMLYVVLISGRD